MCSKLEWKPEWKDYLNDDALAESLFLACKREFQMGKKSKKPTGKTNPMNTKGIPGGDKQGTTKSALAQTSHIKQTKKK